MNVENRQSNFQSSSRHTHPRRVLGLTIGRMEARYPPQPTTRTIFAAGELTHEKRAIDRGHRVDEIGVISFDQVRVVLFVQGRRPARDVVVGVPPFRGGSAGFYFSAAPAHHTDRMSFSARKVQQCKCRVVVKEQNNTASNNRNCVANAKRAAVDAGGTVDAT